MPEYFKLIAVVAVEAGHGAKPHEPAGILINGIYLVVRQTLGEIDMRELETGLCVRLCKRLAAYQQGRQIPGYYSEKEIHKQSISIDGWRSTFNGSDQWPKVNTITG